MIALLFVLPACSALDPGDPSVGGAAPSAEVAGDSIDTSGVAARPFASIIVASTGTADVASGPASSFPIYGTPDLMVAVYFNGLPDNDYLGWIEYVAPDGGTYQLEPVAFSVGDAQAATMALAGQPTPLHVEPAEPTSQGWRVIQILPVDKTRIVLFGMSGEWTVRVYLETPNGAPLASTTFVLAE